MVYKKRGRVAYVKSRTLTHADSQDVPPSPSSLCVLPVNLLAVPFHFYGLPSSGSASLPPFLLSMLCCCPKCECVVVWVYMCMCGDHLLCSDMASG